MTPTTDPAPATRTIALVVAGCFVIENLDVTITATATPALAAALHATPAATGLLISVYLLAVALFIPLSGWLTARLGGRRVFLAAIALFTAASLGCALAATLPELVALRAVQGLGGAMMVPVGRLLVISGAAKPDIPRLMSYVIWPGLVAPVLAPLAGGLITTHLGWPWLFGINVPLGTLAFVAAWRLVRTPPGGRDAGRLDVTGLLLTAIGLGGLTAAAQLVADGTAAPALTTGVAAVALLALGWAGRHLRRTARPLVALDGLRVASFRSSVVGGSLFWMVVSATPYLLPLMFQQLFGWDAVRSGATVLFVFLGNIAVKPTTGVLIDRFGPRALLVGAGLGLSASIAACALLTRDSPTAVIAAVALLAGATRSLGLTGYSTIAFADLHGPALRHANTLSAAAQQTAMGLGVALAAAGLGLGAALTGSGPLSAAAFRVDYLLLAALALLATAEAVRLRRGTGDAIRRVSRA